MFESVRKNWILLRKDLHCLCSCFTNKIIVNDIYCTVSSITVLVGLHVMDKIHVLTVAVLCSFPKSHSCQSL